MHWQLVESDAVLVQALDAAKGAPAVAIDTEFMRRNTFYPQVALVQLCFGDIAYLVDPLCMEDPEPLRELLRDPAVTKVLHAPGEDLEVFQCWLGEMPRPLFDTQRAAALLDLGFGLGYRGLVDKVFAVNLPKEETRSDWLQRPLTEAQCEYAAQDVAWLLPLWRKLEAQCSAQDKLDWVLADGEDACRAQATNGAEYYRRIKNAWKLDRRSLAGLIALCDWRERQARLRNKPRGWIIDDKACLQLAQARPTSRQQLAAAVELPQGAIRRYGQELTELLQGQEQLDDRQLPARLPGPLTAAQRKQLKAAKGRLRQIAEELRSAPEILLQSRDCELLVREANGEEISEPAHWEGWRAGPIIQPLRAYLREMGL